MFLVSSWQLIVIEMVRLFVGSNEVAQRIVLDFAMATE